MNLRIAFFDMDRTLIDGDCDVSWKEFVIERGLAEPAEREEVARFDDEFARGTPDVEAFLRFQLRQFRSRTPEELCPLLERHYRERVEPYIYPEARRTVRRYQERGIPTLLLTATNEAVAAPLAREFGFDAMLATRLEVQNGRYTGGILPPYCFASAKVGAAERYCHSFGLSLRQAGYYGDSIHDIPLLEVVGFPVAVNPQGRLKALAIERGWTIVLWKLEGPPQYRSRERKQDNAQ